MLNVSSFKNLQRLTMLPMNLNSNEVNQRRGFLDRKRIGASLADVDPMELDKSITFKARSKNCYI